MTESSSSIQNDADFRKCLEATPDYDRILMDLGIVEQMIKVTARQIHRLDYKPARDLALETYKFADRTEDERRAYKDFLDLYFNRKAVAGTKRKHRPRTPLSAYDQ